MYLSLPILLSLLSSTALTLPTTTNTTIPTNSHNDTSPSLLKRTKPGWVGSFPNKDCSGPVGPNVHNTIADDICYKFTPTKGMAWIGVNYGSGDDQFSEISFFVDDGCKYLIGGPWGAGNVFQGNGGSGMRCTNHLGMAKSFMLETKLQSIP